MKLINAQLVNWKATNYVECIAFLSNLNITTIVMVLFEAISELDVNFTLRKNNNKKSFSSSITKYALHQ